MTNDTIIISKAGNEQLYNLNTVLKDLQCRKFFGKITVHFECGRIVHSKGHEDTPYGAAEEVIKL